MARARALVTGARGFAGRHFVKALEAAHYHVDGIDIERENGPRVDASDVFRAPFRPSTLYGGTPFRYDLVVHCAAIVGGRATIEGKPLALARNLELDAQLFRWATAARPRRIIYISSSAAYPTEMQTAGWQRRLKEDMIDLRTGRLGVPDELYGWAKLTGEILADRARDEGLPVTVVRPFSGYGEDQDHSYPFRAFAERAKARQRPFTVWGSGQQVRDFIHIDDVVQAAIYFAAEGVNGPVNIGTGIPTSMTDLAHMFCREEGYSPDIETERDQPAGVSYRVADVDRMYSLGFEPTITLEEGIARAMA